MRGVLKGWGVSMVTLLLLQVQWASGDTSGLTRSAMFGRVAAAESFQLVQPAQQETWQRSVPVGEDASIALLQISNDGDVRVVVRELEQLHIIDVEAGGTSSSSARTGVPFTPWDVASGADGSLFLADGHEGNIRVAKRDPAGNILWDVVEGGGHEDVVAQVIATPDGGCAVIGTKNVVVVGYMGVWKFNSQGRLEWSRSIVDGEERFSSGSKILQTDDGGFIAVGTSGYDHEYAAGNFYVVKLDRAGNVAWERTHSKPLDQLEAEGGYFVHDASSTHNGGVFVLGRVYEHEQWREGPDGEMVLLTPNRSHRVAIQFDALGRVQWEQTVHISPSVMEPATFRLPMDPQILQTGTDGHIVAKSTRTARPSNLGDLALFRVNANGVERVALTHSGPVVEFVDEIVFGDDQGFAITKLKPDSDTGMKELMIIKSRGTFSRVGGN